MRIFKYMPYYLVVLGFGALVTAGFYIFSHVPHTEGTKMPFGDMRVAMILPGSIDDNSWCASGYKGLVMIHEELGGKMAYSQNIMPDQAQAELKRYAENGFDFIIANGGEYAAAAEEAASEFPTVKFMITGAYPGNNCNLGTMSFYEEETGFLAGVVAGMASGGKVAFVAGEKLPHMVKSALAFEQGARYVNPAIETKIVYIGTWTDQQKGIEAGKALIAEKFDVIAVSADAAGKPIHGLAKTAGIKTIGWVSDEYELAPGTVITSIITDNAQLLLKGARLVTRGSWKGKQYKFGLRDGVIRLADFRGSLSEDKLKKITEVRRSLRDGLISPLPATSPSTTLPQSK